MVGESKDMMIEDVEAPEKCMKDLLEGFMAGIEDARRKDPEYQKLFAIASDYGYLLSEVCHKMMNVILDACQVLKDKDGIKINNDVFAFFLSLPLLAFITKRLIKNEEGFSCCVDKTYYLLSATLKEVIAKVGEKDAW